MKKKFAYFLLGSSFSPEEHTAVFETGGGLTYIFTVRDFDEARQRAARCLEEGFGIIELCGAFGEKLARELIEVTEGRIGIGFVKNLPEQRELFANFFSSSPED
jgi:hypothetical protein